MKFRDAPDRGQQETPHHRLPLVSVLIATYNQKSFLGQCLDSVLAQVTPFPIEILIHDDASTDGTTDIVRTYAGRYPRLIRPIIQTENQLSRARKAWPVLHRLARGAYLAYCDGDDFWPNPGKLRRQVSFLSSHPEYVLSFHDAEHVDETGRLLKANNLAASMRRDYSQSELRVLKWGWILFGTMVHRNVGLAFPPEYHLAPNGDNFMPMLLARHGGAKFLEDAGPLAYRQHAGGLWTMRSVAQRKAMELQTNLQISSYFIRTGDYQAASELFRLRLSTGMNEYIEAQQT